jgi:hypothetical protein
MGVPTSVLLAEIFIQYLDHDNIINILNKHPIIYYYRYVVTSHKGVLPQVPVSESPAV